MSRFRAIEYAPPVRSLTLHFDSMDACPDARSGCDGWAWDASLADRLQAAATKAVDALEKNPTCDRPSDQIRAATAILEFSLEGVEVADIGERVDELEQLLAEIRDGKPVDGEGGEANGPGPDDGGDPGIEIDPARFGEVSRYSREVYEGGAETGPVGEATGGGDPPPGAALPVRTEAVP